MVYGLSITNSPSESDNPLARVDLPEPEFPNIRIFLDTSSLLTHKSDYVETVKYACCKVIQKEYVSGKVQDTRTLSTGLFLIKTYEK